MLTPHSIKLNDEAEVEGRKFIIVPGLDVFITQIYCDFPLLYSFFILSSLFSSPFSIRNMLRPTLNATRDPMMPLKSKRGGKKSATKILGIG